jgi:hypothetical protein
MIDTAVEARVYPGIRNGDITHMSVFAIARLPLLIYLGCKLDDGAPVDVYQRHRGSESWLWPEIDDPGTQFVLTHTAGIPDATESVLITNLSGTTPAADIPAQIANLPTWTITPSSGPAEDVFNHPADGDDPGLRFSLAC